MNRIIHIYRQLPTIHDFSLWGKTGSNIMDINGFKTKVEIFIFYFTSYPYQRILFCVNIFSMCRYNFSQDHLFINI